MPRRYALGFDRDDFVDANGRPLTPWESVAGVLWASPKSPKEDGVSVGQFPEAAATRPLSSDRSRCPPRVVPPMTRESSRSHADR